MKDFKAEIAALQSDYDVRMNELTAALASARHKTYRRNCPSASRLNFATQRLAWRRRPSARPKGGG